MQVPRLEKIVINVGCGDAVEQRLLIDKVVAEVDDHRRPEADHHPGQEVDRRVQAP